ncbi:MAG TPA: HAD-IC family P-type ATPase, partial [Candidatus Flavonifractor merdavium]|nr:HAD-IC family P-type ATPase [Candidatus Flavonifractor merdavium]
MTNEPYYSKSVSQALEAQQADQKGLSDQQARTRLEQYGPNKLSEGKKKSVLQIFLEQFKDLLVVILIVAALISAASENVESTIVIFAVLILNAILGTVQYLKAEKSLESLKAMSSPTAKVLRGGVRVEVPSADVVPGDIVLLEAGDMVVADGRVLENFSLKVNESSLTGESEGVEKTADVITGGQVALGDQKNMVFSGSLVTYGRATVLVTATGMNTELGKIAALMNQTQQRKTPLQQSLDSFSAKLAIVIMAICAVVFALSVFRTGMGVLDSLMFAVALAVAAIPEALSSIVTIVLAMGTQKMAKQNAIMKDLKAVESLGCVSVICSDKTGTLTQNKMTPQKVYADGSLLEGDDLELVNDVQRLLLKAALLASDATNNEETGASIGDPTEVALVMLGEKFGVDEESYRAQHPRLGELAFDSDRKLMSTLHDIDGAPTLFTKGAIDVLLDRSKWLLTRQGKVELTPERKEEIARINMELSMEGLRVLAFAYRELEAVRPLTLEDEKEFTFIGLISMIDPPRPEAVQAVADAKRGGIRTIMITGDHKVTASAIARQLGIFRDGDEAVSGLELDQMSDADLDERLEKISVYARVSPEHKIRIVNAWQRKGNIVSMTGDGVNDAPALKAADIGCAMGITGTDVAKGAADMTLTDDNFTTIVDAVREGRGIYDNIKKVVGFLLGTNIGEIICVFVAMLLWHRTPLLSMQLLLINLATD